MFSRTPFVFLALLLGSFSLAETHVSNSEKADDSPDSVLGKRAVATPASSPREQFLRQYPDFSDSLDALSRVSGEEIRQSLEQVRKADRKSPDWIQIQDFVTDLSEGNPKFLDELSSTVQRRSGWFPGVRKLSQKLRGGATVEEKEQAVTAALMWMRAREEKQKQDAIISGKKAGGEPSDKKARLQKAWEQLTGTTPVTGSEAGKPSEMIYVKHMDVHPGILPNHYLAAYGGGIKNPLDKWIPESGRVARWEIFTNGFVERNGKRTYFGPAGALFALEHQEEYKNNQPALADAILRADATAKAAARKAREERWGWLRKSKKSADSKVSNPPKVELGEIEPD